MNDGGGDDGGVEGEGGDQGTDENDGVFAAVDVVLFLFEDFGVLGDYLEEGGEVVLVDGGVQGGEGEGVAFGLRRGESRIRE